jgi:hypothetical protein
VLRIDALSLLDPSAPSFADEMPAVAPTIAASTANTSPIPNILLSNLMFFIAVPPCLLVYIRPSASLCSGLRLRLAVISGLKGQD